MTGFDSKRQAAMDKLVEIQEELGMYDDQKPPMTKDEALNMALQALEIHTVWFSRDTMIGKSMHEKGNKAITAIKEALAQPEQEPHNFCPRCGKRTPDPTTIHTCTPPRGLENMKIFTKGLDNA
jgi:hypothetical protein